MMEAYKEYATALFQLAAESGEQEAVYKAFSQVLEVFRREPDYITLLSSRGIPKAERARTLDVCFGGRIPEHLLSFLSLLSDKNRIGQVFACAREYEAMYMASRNRVSARVTSAVALTAEERVKLILALEKRTGKTVVLESVVDPSLIGSIIVEYDGKILDGSVKRRIDTMKEVISNER